MIRADLGRALRESRLDRNLSLERVARATGISGSQTSRIERGLVPSLSIDQACRLGAAVGLDLSARLYPSGDPIRDAGHAALLERLRGRLHPSLTMRTEVPLPVPGDLRAWDAVIRGSGWTEPVEAETRPNDGQALERRITLKLRDAGFDDVILLLLDSSHNRRFVRSSGGLAARFTIDGRLALERLAAGQHPGGSAIILL